MIFNKIALLVAIILTIFGCYNFNNSLDRDSENYQGWPVYGEGEEIPEDAVFTITGNSPSDGEEIIESLPLLNWDDVMEAASYRVRMAATEAGLSAAATVDAGASSDYQYTTFLSHGDVIWWQVAAVNEAGAVSPWSSAVSFSVNLAMSYSSFTPPDGGNTINIQPLLNWDDLTGAESYTLRFSTSSNNLSSSPVITELLLSEYQFSTDIAIGTTIYWQVLPILSDGRIFAWSEISQFTVKEEIVDSVFVEGGSFLMGSSTGARDDEKPSHSINITDFYISKFEITWSKWTEIYNWAVLNDYQFLNTGIAGNSGIDEDDNENEPVTEISWYDAVIWCNAASEYDGLNPVYSLDGVVLNDGTYIDWNDDSILCDWTLDGWRLPTEAEWEYAARGGNTDTNSGDYAGDSNIDNVAWNPTNSGSDTHPVGLKAPNELGLFDMSGNAWEMCWDWYDSDYYDGSPTIDPTGPVNGTDKVRRGGCWEYTEYSCTVYTRDQLPPHFAHNYNGFRLSRSF